MFPLLLRKSGKCTGISYLSGRSNLLRCFIYIQSIILLLVHRIYLLCSKIAI